MDHTLWPFLKVSPRDYPYLPRTSTKTSDDGSEGTAGADG